MALLQYFYNIHVLRAYLKYRSFKKSETQIETPNSKALIRRTPTKKDPPFSGSNQMEPEARQNCLMAINFLVSLLKKNWNNAT